MKGIEDRWYHTGTEDTDPEEGGSARVPRDEVERSWDGLEGDGCWGKNVIFGTGEKMRNPS